MIIIICGNIEGGDESSHICIKKQITIVRALTEWYTLSLRTYAKIEIT